MTDTRDRDLYHIRDLREGCSQQGCKGRATKAVYSQHNACLGRFCAPHAKLRCRILNADAREAREARAAETTAIEWNEVPGE